MAKFKLIKMSAPGWEKEFTNEKKLKRELFNHICTMCCADEDITMNSSIGDMLSTPCGCEYDVEGL